MGEIITCLGGCEPSACGPSLGARGCPARSLESSKQAHGHAFWATQGVGGTSSPSHGAPRLLRDAPRHRGFPPATGRTGSLGQFGGRYGARRGRCSPGAAGSPRSSSRSPAVPVPAPGFTARLRAAASSIPAGRLRRAGLRAGLRGLGPGSSCCRRLLSCSSCLETLGWTDGWTDGWMDGRTSAPRSPSGRCSGCQGAPGAPGLAVMDPSPRSQFIPVHPSPGSPSIPVHPSPPQPGLLVHSSPSQSRLPVHPSPPHPRLPVHPCPPQPGLSVHPSSAHPRLSIHPSP